MKAFTGSFTFKVDKKGRISVPADYRALLTAQARFTLRSSASCSCPR